MAFSHGGTENTEGILAFASGYSVFFVALCEYMLEHEKRPKTGRCVRPELWPFAMGESPRQKWENLALGGEVAFTRSRKAMYRCQSGFIFKKINLEAPSLSFGRQ